MAGAHDTRYTAAFPALALLCVLDGEIVLEDAVRVLLPVAVARVGALEDLAASETLIRPVSRVQPLVAWTRKKGG